MSGGNEFQRSDAATGNGRRPKVVIIDLTARRIRKLTHKRAVPERRAGVRYCDLFMSLLPMYSIKGNTFCRFFMNVIQIKITNLSIISTENLNKFHNVFTITTF